MEESSEKNDKLDEEASVHPEQFLRKKSESNEQTEEAVDTEDITE